MKNQTEVSVIIPVYGLNFHIIKTISSLLTQSIKPKEIIIVSDQKSQRDIRVMEDIVLKYRAVAERMGIKIKIISRLGRKGLSSARNLGAREASSEIVAFIDSDCIASKQWIESLLKGYNSPRVGGVGGPIYPISTAPYFAKLVHFTLNQPRVVELENGDVISIAGCNASYRKSLVLKLLFDESVLWGQEDNDFNFRLLANGYELRNVKSALVYHSPRENIIQFMRWRYSLGKSYWLYIKNLYEYPPRIRKVVISWIPRLRWIKLIYILIFPLLLIPPLLAQHKKLPGKVEKIAMFCLEIISEVLHLIGHMRGLREYITKSKYQYPMKLKSTRYAS